MTQISVRKYDSIETLAATRPEFSALQHIKVRHTQNRQWTRGNTVSYDLQITVLGKTGYGKSSLINTLVCREVLETSATDVCTTKGQCVDFQIGPEENLSIVDVPGVGESSEKDVDHYQLYEDLITCSDLLLYVLRADQRDWSIDQDIFSRLLHSQRNKVLIVLTQCDKIEPASRKETALSKAQQEHLDQKLSLVRQGFPGVVDIIPCSVAWHWNISRLAQTITEKLLQSKGVSQRNIQTNSLPAQGSHR